MASYSTTIAAIALGVERKQLENLLGRCRIPGTSRGKQGRARRLSRSSVLGMAAVLRLQGLLGIPASRAVDLLNEGLLSDSGDGRLSDRSELRRGPFLLTVDVVELEREIVHALAEAIEMGPRPRRGRPRGTARTRPG